MNPAVRISRGKILAPCLEWWGAFLFVRYADFCRYPDASLKPTTVVHPYITHVQYLGGRVALYLP